MSISITTMVNGDRRLILSSWPLAPLAALSTLSRAIGASLSRRHQRRALRELADQDDQHLLSDIGLTREEAYREAAKWFWQR